MPSTLISNGIIIDELDGMTYNVSGSTLTQEMLEEASRTMAANSGYTLTIPNSSTYSVVWRDAASLLDTSISTTIANDHFASKYMGYWDEATETSKMMEQPNETPLKKSKGLSTYLENIFELDPARLGKNDTFYILTRRDGFTKVQIGPKYGTKAFKMDYKIPIIRESSFAAFEESISPISSTCDVNTFYFRSQTKEGYLIFEEQ